MWDDSTPRLNRRKILKTVGGVGMAGIAGCSGDGDDGSDGGDGSDGSDGSNGSDGGDSSDGGGDGSDGDDSSDFPERDIDFIIPYGTGGGYDTYARMVAPYIAEHLPNNVNVVPQNVTGAGGQIATEQVYNSQPNGYTIMIVNLPVFSRQQLIQDVRYDLTEMQHFAQIASDPSGVASGTNTDITSWDDYVSAVQNEEVKFGSTGPLSTFVLVPVLLGEIAGLYPAENVIDNTVTFSGGSQAQLVQAVKGGEAQITSGTFTSMIPFVESGDIRPLMVTITDDSPPESASDAETLATADIENAQEIEDITAYRRTIAGPPGIPEERARILSEAIGDAINDEEFQAEAEEAGLRLAYEDSEGANRIATNMVNLWEEQGLVDLLRQLANQQESE